MAVCPAQIIEAHIAVTRVVYIRRNRRGTIGRAQHPRHPTRALGIGGHCGVGGFPGDPGGGKIELEDMVFETVVGLCDGGAVKRVGFDDVRTRAQEARVDIANQIRLRDAQKIIVAAHIQVMVGESTSAEVGLRQCMSLNHGAHGTVQGQNALSQGLYKSLCGIPRPARHVRRPTQGLARRCATRRPSARACDK